jgi:hypothetical protein
MRRPRFSIRSLMIAVAVVGIALGLGNWGIRMGPRVTYGGGLYCSCPECERHRLAEKAAWQQSGLLVRDGRLRIPQVSTRIDQTQFPVDRSQFSKSP